MNIQKPQTTAHEQAAAERPVNLFQKMSMEKSQVQSQAMGVQKPQQIPSPVTKPSSSSLSILQKSQGVHLSPSLFTKAALPRHSQASAS